MTEEQKRENIENARHFDRKGHIRKSHVAIYGDANQPTCRHIGNTVGYAEGSET